MRVNQPLHISYERVADYFQLLLHNKENLKKFGHLIQYVNTL
jgi:hypothetical protein